MTPIFARRAAAQIAAWADEAWSQVLGKFGGVLSPQNRHAAIVVSIRRRRRSRRRIEQRRKAAA